MNKAFSTVLTMAALLVGGAATANDSCSTDCCCEDGRFQISGDLLIMHPCQDSHQVKFATGAGSTADNKSWTEHDWELGFRVDGRYRSDCNGWDMGVQFTHLDATADDSFKDDAGTELRVLYRLADGAMTNHAVDADSTVKSKHDLEYYTIDAVLGYNCCLCDGFENRTYGGFRALSVDQDASMRFISTPAGFTTAGDGRSFDGDYKGYGVTAGIEPRVNFEDSGCGSFSIFGKTGASMVVGDRDHTVKLTQAGAVTSFDVANKPCHAAFGYEIAMGASWESCLCGTTVSLGAGYEFNYWTDVDSPVDNPELMIHGALVRANVGF